MKLRLRSHILPALLSVSLAGAPACQSSEPTDRWVTTSNTAVDIDWDAVGKAYKEATGPEDFERRVNEIYTGDEVISVAVSDEGDKAQVVTGFFDKNGSGAIDEGEKVFEIKRNITGEGSGQYQIAGYGAYHGYHSPMFDIMAGMMLGSMIMGPMSPGYVRSAPYVTPPTRREALTQQRQAFRAANPGRTTTPKASKTGRSYGERGRAFNGGRSSGGRSGGARFGAQAATPGATPRRLEA